jgi:hypothetical protein
VISNRLLAGVIRLVERGVRRRFTGHEAQLRIAALERLRAAVLRGGM